MRCLIAQNCTGGLAMVDGIHVYGYQLDMRRQFVKYLHHFVLVGDDRTVRFGKSYSRPEWVLSIAEQAKAHGIPVFMKEDLLPIMGDERMIQELPEQFTRRIQ
jgi:hypothetical protein